MLSWSELRSRLSPMAQNPLQPVDREAQPHWDQLASLLLKPTRRLAQLSRAECRRWHCSTASGCGPVGAAADSTSRTYTVHVNQLLARAHHIIYSRQKTNLRTLFLFLRTSIRRCFSGRSGLVLASLAVSVHSGFWERC